jgi:Uncharacterized protein conserved in bacteria
MRILIDGDACPHVKIVEDISEHFKVQCIVVYNMANDLKLTYAEPVLVPARPGSADDEIVRITIQGDIVITEDKELIARCLDKGAIVMHPDGYTYPRYVWLSLGDIKYIGFFKDPKNTFSESLMELNTDSSPLLHRKRVFASRLILYLTYLQEQQKTL